MTRQPGTGVRRRRTSDRLPTMANRNILCSYAKRMLEARFSLSAVKNVTLLQVLSRLHNEQHGTNWCTVCPTNIYGTALCRSSFAIPQNITPNPFQDPTIITVFKTRTFFPASFTRPTFRPPALLPSSCGAAANLFGSSFSAGTSRASSCGARCTTARPKQ